MYEMSVEKWVANDATGITASTQVDTTATALTPRRTRPVVRARAFPMGVNEQ